MTTARSLLRLGEVSDARLVQLRVNGRPYIGLSMTLPLHPLQ